MSRRGRKQRALTSTINVCSCPIRGCPLAGDQQPWSLTTPYSVVKHLHGESHKHSLHLVDPAVCQQVGLFICSHSSCPTSPNIFFTSEAALHCHNEEHHPPLNPPLERPTSTLPPQAIPPPTYPLHPCNQSTSHNSTTTTLAYICHTYLSPNQSESQQPADQHWSSSPPSISTIPLISGLVGTSFFVATTRPTSPSSWLTSSELS